MTSKIIINRYEKGRDTQFMEVTILEESTNGKPVTVCGPWLNGESICKVTPPKLRVDIIDTEKNSDFDLDSIAKPVIFNNGALNYSEDIFYQGNEHHNQDGNDLLSSDKKNKLKIDEISEFLSRKAEITDCHGNIHYEINKSAADPLDQKLQKIRENNEKIMENILLLNKTLDYTRKKEMEEMMSARLALVSFICDKCGKSFTKNSAFQYHMRQHRIKGEPVSIKPGCLKAKKPWVCPHCFQVWPREDLIQEHLLSSSCATLVKDMKEVLQYAQKSHVAFLTQCEFCEKLFSSVTKAIKHQRQHVTNINYECTECSEMFFGFEAAVRHWEHQCPWIRDNYTFSIYKCFACNVCYEKFGNLENLYQHRYEQQHFLPKMGVHEDTGTEEDGVRGEETEVHDGAMYQCEECGRLCTQLGELMQHHQGEHSQVLCQLCGEISEDRNSFVSHMKQHSSNWVQSTII